MTDLHHNIFHYYRGVQQSGQDRDQQWEDNTTKALINTLEHSRSTVALKFLEWLGIAATGQVRFELQKMTISTGEIQSRSKRLLLGLVPSKGTKDPCAGLDKAVTEKEDSRPDAWIYGSDFVVLIESKVKGFLEPNQMEMHCQKLQAGTDQQPQCEVRTWAEVYQFFVGILPELSGKDEWIVEQFKQYLEGIGMAEFTGLEREIFDYFITHDDEEMRQRVKGTMQAFAEKVLGGLQAFDSSFYQSYDVGPLRFKDEYCWVAFGPGNKGYRQWAHQTISLYAYKLDVFVNVELIDAVGRLRKKIRQDGQAFRETVSSLPVPFSVQLEERIEKQVTIYDYYAIAKLEADVLKKPHSRPYGLKDPQSYGFRYVEKLLEQINLPCLSVRRRIDRHRALELSQGNGDSLVDEVVGIMKAFHPLVKFINEPDYAKHTLGQR
ncbi:MAG: hypothetical protein JXA14_04065 [Anaerolineae bacterium]|nr:hypothetical protein [Anaerolineae bacterium]